MPGDCMTCMGMCGSGVRTGKGVILQEVQQTRLDLHQARSGFTAAVAGTTTAGTAVRRIAATARRTAGSTTLVSAS